MTFHAFVAVGFLGPYSLHIFLPGQEKAFTYRMISNILRKMVGYQGINYLISTYNTPGGFLLCKKAVIVGELPFLNADKTN
jgi:hypothetical protein